MVARRAGSVWYVGGINGQNAAQSVPLSLAFLGSGDWQLTLIRDGDSDRTFDTSSRAVTARDTIDISVRANGGFACRLVRR